MDYDPKKFGDISFTDLIKNYTARQSDVVQQVKTVASSLSNVTPGKFLLLQFSMSQVTQIGESISNLISQVQSAIMKMIQNQQTR